MSAVGFEGEVRSRRTLRGEHRLADNLERDFPGRCIIPLKLRDKTVDRVT